MYAFMIIAIRATADVVKALGIEKSLKLVEVSSLLRKNEGEGKKKLSQETREMSCLLTFGSSFLF